MSDQLHRFTVGQHVEIIPSRLLSTARGSYEIRRLIPISGIDPQYRLKGRNEVHERIVSERSLRLLPATTIFS